VCLDFARHGQHFLARQMNKRFASFAVVMLYLCAAVLGGLLHDHHDNHAADHCAACHWQTSDHTTAPAALSISLPAMIAVATPMPVTFTAADSFLPANATRAPPLTTA
jgi:hypothetical protein